MILETQDQLRQAAHEEGLSFRCGDCGETKPVQAEGGAGYGYMGEGATEKPVCYECCGKRDQQRMIEDGRAVLYLTCEPAHKSPRRTRGKVGNWPDSLSFPCHTRPGRHNIAGTRYDCWFVGPDGYEWHGVTYGDNTQICHCKRTKTRGGGTNVH
jgi:hypothetical protein